MQLDRKTINRLLALDDDQLRAFIRNLAERQGLDLSAFRLSINDIAGIRRVLSEADDETLRRIAEQFGKRNRA